MLQRSKSFSKGGNIIDRALGVQKYQIDPETLKRMLHAKHIIPGMRRASMSDQIETAVKSNAFDRVPGRQKPSPFLLHNIKDTNPCLDYQNRKEKTMTRNAFYPVRRQQDQRLSQMMAPAIQHENEQQLRMVRRAHSCKKHKETYQQKGITIPSDLMKARKTFHSIDFAKQTMRPFDKTLSKLEKDSKINRANSASDLGNTKNSLVQMVKDPLDIKGRVHSFNSYTQRDFLSDKKVSRAPQVSGIDWFKVNPEKVRGNWKTIEGPKFEKMTRKLSRFEGEGPQWFTKLQYNVREAQGKSQVKMGAQTNRKDNLVKSEYPMRLAM